MRKALVLGKRLDNAMLDGSLFWAVIQNTSQFARQYR